MTKKINGDTHRFGDTQRLSEGLLTVGFFKQETLRVGEPRRLSLAHSPKIDILLAIPIEYIFTKVQIPSCAVSLGTACRKSCCAPELAV